MNDVAKKVRFGPGFFWVLMLGILLMYWTGAFFIKEIDERSSIVLLPLWWLSAFAGTIINLPRWRQLGKAGKFGLVFLIIVCLMPVIGPLGFFLL